MVAAGPARLGQADLALTVTDRSGHIDRALRAEAYKGLQLAVALRGLACFVITCYLVWEIGFDRAIHLMLMLAVLMALGLAQLALRTPERDRMWLAALFSAVDGAVIVGGLLAAGHFDAVSLPPPMRLGFDTVLFLAGFIALSSLGNAPALVIWSGVTMSLCWLAGWLWVGMQPGVVIAPLPHAYTQATQDQIIATLTNPWMLQPPVPLRQVEGLLLITAITATAAYRARRMVRRQAEADRARLNLSRYFSPTVVEDLSGMDDPFGEARQLSVAVLFADLVGFTRATEGRDPHQVIALVRDVQRGLARAVFACGGTLDKFLGDGLMASFGTPRPSGHEATDALAAARSMLVAMTELNDDRVRRGEAPIQLSIGLHFGPVTLGNIGDENRIEYTVVGETVNVASRLEKLTREHHAALIASDAFVRRLTAEATVADLTTTGLVRLPDQAIRGLKAPVGLWLMAR